MYYKKALELQAELERSSVSGAFLSFDVLLSEIACLSHGFYMFLLVICI